jgi:nicotinate-nucleotide pyrophosphorylase (carboxylating)
LKLTLKSILNKKSFTYDPHDFLSRLFREDKVENDLTTRYTVSGNRTTIGRIMARETGILAGLGIVKDIFRMIDRSVKFSSPYSDGHAVRKGARVLTIHGRTASILRGERTALNMLQRLSGIATETRRLVRLLKGTQVKLLDTRKTTPGLRYFEKYATAVGGALNHRLNLADGILIKENHITAAGSIHKAVFDAVKRKPGHLMVEVEVRNIPELKEALQLPVNLIMLDNFSLKDIKTAVRLTKGKKLLEVSGGVNAGNIRSLAALGVDYISCGAITHSAKALDLSLLID